MTFPYPIYAKWADAYKKESGTELNYQSIGSGGGVKQIKAKTVAFEASDDPLLRAELEREALVQFPMVMAGIVPVVNVPGVTPGQLVIDGPTLAKSFSATSRLGMTPRSPSSIPVSSCHRNRSLSFTARTVQARLSTSPIIWTRCARSGKAQKAKRACPTMWSRHDRVRGVCLR